MYCKQKQLFAYTKSGLESSADSAGQGHPARGFYLKLAELQTTELVTEFLLQIYHKISDVFSCLT